MSDPPLADSKNGIHRMEDRKSRGRLRLWRKVKLRNRHRNADCSASLSPPNDSYWELDQHYIKEEKVVIEGILTIGNSAFASSSKPSGSIRIPNLKDFFLCSRRRSGCSEKVTDERIPFSSYAKLQYSSSPRDKEKKKRVSAEEKLTHKNKMVNKAVYISSPSRKGVPVSAHELHYIANRAQAEELRRKTFLPYRQGVLACVGFPASPSRAQGRIVQPLHIDR